jgi:L-2-hydroxyglutarate oxidase
MHAVDVTIIGAGVVGLATAYQLIRMQPGLQVLVLEKEPTVGRHQTGHNSGVIHSGIYYRPGSLKATNCRTGRLEMVEFCRQEGIAHEMCGKVIVATREDEIPALLRIHQRGQANGIVCDLIGPDRLREIEPHAAGLRALHVPEAGIVDYARVCERLVHRIEAHGSGRVRCGAEVFRLVRHRSRTIVLTEAGDVCTRWVVGCGGLQSDRVVAMGGDVPPARIVPFRGEYFEIGPEARHLVQSLIYPVPDPAFPFLGVHFTRTIGGMLECGPNAVLALGREAYPKFQIDPDDLWDALSYPGFWRLARRHWRQGGSEMWRSLSKRAFVQALARLVPEIDASHLEVAPAGIRAQALGPDGALADDFLIVESPLGLFVCNAPSPAATASLNIGRTIAERLLARC